MATGDHQQGARCGDLIVKRRRIEALMASNARAKGWCELGGGILVPIGAD